MIQRIWILYNTLPIKMCNAFVTSGFMLDQHFESDIIRPDSDTNITCLLDQPFKSRTVSFPDTPHRNLQASSKQRAHCQRVQRKLQLIAILSFAVATHCFELLI